MGNIGDENDLARRMNMMMMIFMMKMIVKISLRGDWGPDEFCPFGAYATGFELKVQFI